MLLSPSQIQSIVEKGLPDSQVTVRDLTGGQDHYEVSIVSSGFAGKSLVERHRLVYSFFGSAVGNEIHALSLKTLTPEELEKRGI